MKKLLINTNDSMIILASTEIPVYFVALYSLFWNKINIPTMTKKKQQHSQAGLVIPADLLVMS